MNKEKILNSAIKVLNIEIDALRKSISSIDKNFFDAVKLINSINSQGRVVIIGMGKSGHIGKKISATLASTGTPAFSVHPGEAGHGDLGMITTYDVVIAISQSGKSDELINLLPYLKRKKISLIAMTGSLKSELAINADIVIDTSVDKEACPLGLAPTSSTTVSLALGDALAISLLESSNFTAENFAETHPSGLLGKRLLITVEDIMYKADKVDLTTPEIFIKDALISMSNIGMGILTICEKNHIPIGVFTDGDLRRCLDAEIDIKKTKIKEVMTKDFVTINQKSLAVEALNIMEESKILALPVIDRNNKIKGLINMRQILQSGLI